MYCDLTGAGRTKSVFDIFREDVVGDVESTPVENTFLEVCINMCGRKSWYVCTVDISLLIITY